MECQIIVCWLRSNAFLKASSRAMERKTGQVIDLSTILTGCMLSVLFVHSSKYIFFFSRSCYARFVLSKRNFDYTARRPEHTQAYSPNNSGPPHQPGATLILHRARDRHTKGIQEARVPVKNPSIPF
jgi:hypothetical protein